MNALTKTTLLPWAPERTGEAPAAQPAARSAMVTSSVSPERCEITAA